MSKLTDLTIADAGRLFRNKSLSPVELTQAFLDRIEKVNPQLNAFISVTREGALEQARNAEQAFMQGHDKGPLQGIPCAIKDNIDVVGVPTTCHSRILESSFPETDAFVTARLRGVGAVLLGKTALHEFARGGSMWDLPWPPARNPWDTSKHPGGSSSGSGAAVAAQMAPAALGTDTGGSVRHPATACGVIGLKPTYGLVSRRGVFPVSFSLDVVGPITRTVRDNALLFEAIAGHDSEDPTSLSKQPDSSVPQTDTGIRGIRIGLIEHFYREDAQANPQFVQALENALSAFVDLGSRVERVRLSPLQHWASCGNAILLAESYVVHEEWLSTRPQDYSPAARSKFLAGAFVSSAKYIKALQMRSVLCREYASAMQNFDILVTLSSLQPPCSIDDIEELNKSYDQGARMPFSVAGAPALSVPIGFTREGLPIGMQIAASAFEESLLFRVAEAFCAHTGWLNMRPGALQADKDAVRTDA